MPSGSAWWRTTRAAPGSSCADRPGDAKITRYCREKPAPPGRLFPFPRQNQADRAICPGTAFSPANIGQNFLPTFLRGFLGFPGRLAGNRKSGDVSFFLCYQFATKGAGPGSAGNSGFLPPAGASKPGVCYQTPGFLLPRPPGQGPRSLGHQGLPAARFFR